MHCVIVCVNRNSELDRVSAVTVVSMPTVLLLDVSLSMNRTVPGTAVSSPVADMNTYRHLAIRGINSMLDYLAANNKLEFVSLVCELSSFYSCFGNISATVSLETVQLTSLRRTLLSSL